MKENKDDKKRTFEKRLRLWLGAALLVLGLTAGTTLVQAATPYSKNGRLSIKNGKVVNKKGKAFVIKGVSTHGLSWYPEYVNKKAFKQMRDKWGVNTVRLAMYTADYNGYCNGGSKSELKKLIDNGVKYATELGMYVIIDWHILSDGNPLTYRKEAKQFFKEVAKKYASYGNVIFEICNEPNGGEGSWENIKKYARPIIKTIRSVNKKAIIIVGTPTWSQEVDKPLADPIKGYQNIAYAFHFYAGTHKDDLRNRLETAVKGGLPVIVTEFGISDASGNGGVFEKEGNRWIEMLNKYKIGRVCWNLSNKNESSALLKPSSKKTSGWSQSDLSASGKWLVKAYTGKKLSSGGGKAEKTAAEEPAQEETSGSAGGQAPAYDSTDGGKHGESAGSVKLTADLTQENCWQSGEKYFTQYKLRLENQGSAASAKWTVETALKEDYVLSDKWCANYEKKGKTLTITPLDWNSRLEPQGTTEIGFILESSSVPSVASVTVTAQ